jgi:hypothetical protein
MFLDRLTDAGIMIHGDGSKVSERVQSIADSTVSLLPKMGSSMMVSVTNNTLQLFWQTRDRSMQVLIDSALRVAVKVSDGTINRTHYCAGESSALGSCLEKGLTIYRTVNKV